MTDLITRLEAAEEGSRELSDEVLLACGWNPVKAGQGGDTAKWTIPCPTTSLDAAKSLLPSGWAALLDIASDGETLAAVRDTLKGLSPIEGKGASAPLALCAAILKARQ